MLEGVLKDGEYRTHKGIEVVSILGMLEGGLKVESAYMDSHNSRVSILGMLEGVLKVHWQTRLSRRV